MSNDLFKKIDETGLTCTNSVIGKIISLPDLAELMRLAKIGADAEKLLTAEEWGEDDRDVIWWTLPFCEPPYVGSPLNCDWVDGIYTHWTPIIEPKLPNEQMEG